MRYLLAPALTAALAGVVTAAEAPTCRPDPDGKQLTVQCSDGKRWTVRSAGLILPPLLRCDERRQECCQTGFRSLRDIQLMDLLRVGEGRSPVCHMLATDVLKNPPAKKSAAPAAEGRVPEADEVEPLPGDPRPACPRGQYPAAGKCHEPAALLKRLHAAPVPDHNRVLVPEAQPIVRALRDQFDRSGRCPKDALDIGVLTRIYQAAARRAELLPGEALDVGPLIVRPADPYGNRFDPGLPASCGYNATFTQWHQTSFHCFDQRLCFDQSHDTLMHACVGLLRAAGEPYFAPTMNCQNVPPCSAGGAGGACTGTACLTALGEGVFLRIMEAPGGRPYYYGLLFSPARPAAAQARTEAAQARTLLQEIVGQIGDPQERARVQRALSPGP